MQWCKLHLRITRGSRNKKESSSNGGSRSNASGSVCYLRPLKKFSVAEMLKWMLTRINIIFILGCLSFLSSKRGAASHTGRQKTILSGRDAQVDANQSKNYLCSGVLELLSLSFLSSNSLRRSSKGLPT